MVIGVEYLNGRTYSVSIFHRILTVNGLTYSIPEHVANLGDSIYITNKHIFINGYEFLSKKKKFKRTLRAFFYYFSLYF